MVPVNSASEDLLREEAKNQPRKEAETGHETTPVVAGGAGGSDPAGAPVAVAVPSPTDAPNGDATKGDKPKKGDKPGKGEPAKGGKGGAAATASAGKASRAECGAALDRYLDLLIAADGRFAGLPPELLNAAKQQGFSQVGQKNPCDAEGISREQHSCAMAAKTGDTWKRCFD